MVWPPPALWFWHRLPATIGEEVFVLLKPSNLYTRPQFTCVFVLRQAWKQTFGVIGNNKKGSAPTDPDPNAPLPHERERSYASLYPKHV